MAVLKLRPTLKRVQLAYAACALLFLLVLYLYSQFFYRRPAWVVLPFLLVFLWPARAHLRARREKLVLRDGELRFASGVFSKNVRVVRLIDVVGVRVEQRPAQRLLGVGDVVVSTAEAGADMVMEDIDNPRRAADRILAARSEEGTLQA